MKQITIIGKNRPGMLAEITEALALKGVNIETFDAEAADDLGVMILTVDKIDIALHEINSLPGVRAVSEEAILIRLKDEPGALAAVARRFKDANINLLSMRILRREDDYSIAALSAERTETALNLVKDILIA